jgi:hypothetical protein
VKLGGHWMLFNIDFLTLKKTCLTTAVVLAGVTRHLNLSKQQIFKRFVLFPTVSIKITLVSG